MPAMNGSESESPSGECKQAEFLRVDCEYCYGECFLVYWCIGPTHTGGSEAATMDDAKLLRKSAKRILTGTELISIGLEPYQARSVVL